MKLTKHDLQLIFSGAKSAYLDESAGDLDNQQFLAQCYVKSILQVLKLDLEVEFPTRSLVESVEE